MNLKIMLELHADKENGVKKVILQDISLQIGGKQNVDNTGQNGSGKSTLAKIAMF